MNKMLDNVKWIINCHVFSGPIVIDSVYLCSRWTNDLSVHGRLLSRVSTFISSEHLFISLSNLCRFLCKLSKDVFFLLLFYTFYFASFSVDFLKPLNKVVTYPLNYILFELSLVNKWRITLNLGQFSKHQKNSKETEC